MQSAPRFAHAAGLTSICFTGDGSQFVTAGQDGDVRLWESIDDDDPNSFHVGNSISSLVAKRDTVYAALDNNNIQTISLPMGNVNGIAARFTSTVTHMALSRGTDFLLASSSDFTIKWIKLEDSSFKEFEGHQAPVLSVALDPKEEFIISASGDGTVKIWKINDGSCVRTLNILPFSNDFDLLKPLSRIAWEPVDAQQFAVPVGKEVHIYNRNTWTVAHSLNDATVASPLSICCYSPNGKNLAASSLDGIVYVWDLEKRKFLNELKPVRNLTITSLAWHPDNHQNLLYCNIEGHISMFSSVLTQKPEKNGAKVESFTKEVAQMDFSVEFEDENFVVEEVDEDMETVVAASAKKPSKPLAFEEEEENEVEDDDEFSRNSDLGALKASYGFDETGHLTAPIENRETVEMRQPTPEPSWMPIPTQRAFIPNSTPTSQPERFMKWNQVGIIKQYNNDTETSVEVEFHDTSYHHAIHVENSVHNYTMADISYGAVVLASNQSPARLCVTQIGSVDAGKEWDLEMPSEEGIVCLCIGKNFIAVASDSRLVRILSIGGIQREIFSIAGPIVSMAACGDKLAVVYHSGMGLTDEHSMAVCFLEVNRGRVVSRSMVTCPLALSSKSSLTWIGYSDEGAFCYMDTKGILRMRNASFNGTWLPIMDARQHTGGKSDHIWIVSVQERSGDVRGILCKGSKFPTFLPRPTLMVFPWGLPMCEMDTDKGKFEEICLKARIRHADLTVASAADTEGKYEETLGDIQKSELESIVKLFILACKAERDLRALDVARLMPNSKSIQALIDLAAKLRRRGLAEKLSDLAREKAAEEASKFPVESHLTESNGEVRQHRSQADNYANNVEDEDIERINSPVDYENSTAKHKPLNRAKIPADSLLLKPKPVKLRASLGNSARNPFRHSGNFTDPPEQLHQEERGKSIFDDLVVEAPKVQKDSNMSIGKGKRKKSLESTEVGGMKQSKLSFDARQTPTNNKKTGSSAASTFSLWLSSNREVLTSEFKRLEGSESVDELELNTFAVKKFKQLSEEEKKQWSQKKDQLTNEIDDETSSRSNSPLVSSTTTEMSVDRRLSSFAYHSTE